ncbi:neo-calmodulin-like [Ciona intestinalis]
MSSDKLSEEEQVIFTEAFKKFDSEGSNFISIDDVGSVLRAAGQAPTESELEDFKKELDPKNSGEAAFKDLIDLYARIMKTTLEMDDELTEAFRVFDKDLKGHIMASDLRHHLTTLGEKLSPEEVDELIKDADSSGDGKINYTEFCFSIIHDNTT